MEPLARWLKKQGDTNTSMLRIFAVIAAALFAISAVAFAVDIADGGIEVAAYFVVAGMFVLTMALGIPALRSLKQPKKGPSLQELQTAAFMGKLEATLGDRAGVLSEAAANMEQMNSLLEFGSVDADVAASLKQEGDDRMRRMVSLTIAPPGSFGLTLQLAELQIQEDAKWLKEVRILVESTREHVLPSTLDQTLTNLRAYVAAREEAVGELRASV